MLYKGTIKGAYCASLLSGIGCETFSWLQASLTQEYSLILLPRSSPRGQLHDERTQTTASLSFLCSLCQSLSIHLSLWLFLSLSHWPAHAHTHTNIHTYMHTHRHTHTHTQHIQKPSVLTTSYMYEGWLYRQHLLVKTHTHTLSLSHTHANTQRNTLISNRLFHFTFLVYNVDKD